ncbi:MAG: two-component sensor histidine kinase [Loktanella sp.]|nr:two-component sensor histidine kinase [Loktanella sp.]
MTDQLIKFIEHLPLPVVLIGEDRRIIASNATMRTVLGEDWQGRHFITALRQPLLIEAVETALVTGAAQRTVFLDRDGGRDRTFSVAVSTEPGYVARDRFLSIMAREADRMTRLVDDLLSLSRVEETSRMRPQDPVDLAALVDSALVETGPVIDTVKARLSVSLTKGTIVPGDAGQLRQVIGNLIENAVKYGPEGGTITITLSDIGPQPRLRADGVALTVHNEGEGIAEHHLPRLTERFYRVDNHRSRARGGTGLGLSIVKHIITRHRGRLEIDSAPGQGVTVRIILPVQT